MDIKILQLVAGAKAATGIAVIIDVFRAFTTECYFMANGAKTIYPIAEEAKAYALREKHSDYILAGERNEVMLPWFDYGNSPAHIQHVDFTGKTIIHTTSAGTQGIENAIYADEILTGSFVNASAIAKYIQKKNPKSVSLVCMGKATIHPTEEDTFCAEYIKSLLEGTPYPLHEQIIQLRRGEGQRFFQPSNQIQCPEEDFSLCVNANTFPFVLKAVPSKSEEGLYEIVKITP